jgi:hypothetical protein
VPQPTTLPRAVESKIKKMYVVKKIRVKNSGIKEERSGKESKRM